MNRQVIAIVGCVLLLLTGAPEAQGQGEWARFRDPNAGDVPDDPALPDTWSETENVVWKTDIPGLSWSSPVVSGDDERRQRHRVPLLRFPNRRLPYQTTADRVDGHELRVERRHEQCVAENCHATIHASAARPGRPGRHVLEDPEDAPRLGVEGHHVVRRLGDVHDPVDDQRRGGEVLQ